MDRDKAISFMHDLLRNLLTKGGSDLFITVGAPPSMKIDGKMVPVTNQPLTSSHVQVLVRSIMNDKQSREYEETQECNFAISLPNVSRFRVNAFAQRGSPGMVLRVINSEIPKFESLKLPPVLRDISMTKRGLVIFVGGTGSGKSTSLAAMVGYRNENSFGHIVTIEDPIEFVHKHKNCIITQREVGVDTEDYDIALKNTLRQAPDVILIGEIRDRKTMEHAIAFAETGHLCLSTLHANSTNQALDRIINFFPDERRAQLLMDLSLNLKSVISQRLLPIKDEEGRVPAVEVLLNTPLMADLIFKGHVHEMKALIAKSNELGMQTFDQHLFHLIEAGLITMEDGLRNADSVNDLRLRLKLDSKDAKDNDLLEGTAGLMVEETDDDAGLIAPVKRANLG
ncbi:MAG: PilT/PilU family type 4a pilus ATPase [Gammaproteobacteria bacterium]|nr:PilT/PilU family type 4a pilus ATPase [Gammaproteobacteria bacterium]MDH3608990.1 PilT/PilU family type 4a pilus ATPase [Gammaproteobacteria bacterium]NNC66548.1 PilT/PilU family type 4a pilus ATPase [Gammaproteobacteria bacterium]